jgi:prevent-host-death family protein
MEITATELKNNLGKYLTAAADEDIVITKNGKVIAHLVGPDRFAGEYTPDEYAKWSEGFGKLLLGESATYTYDADVPGSESGSGSGNGGPEWELTRDGKAVAKLEPVKKKKRKLGFIHVGPVSAETEAALFEPTVEPEVLEKWENEKW